MKQSIESLHAEKQSRQQLESEVQQEQQRLVWDLACMAFMHLTGGLGTTSQKSLLQKAEKQKAQRLAKQLEDKNVQVHKLRWVFIVDLVCVLTSKGSYGAIPNSCASQERGDRSQQARVLKRAV